MLPEVPELETVSSRPLTRLLQNNHCDKYSLFCDNDNRGELEPPTLVELGNPNHLARGPPYPFDATSGGDALLRSSDGKVFHGHTQIMRLTAPVLYGAFMNSTDVLLIQKSDPVGGTDYLRILNVTEETQVLFVFLRLSYPFQNVFPRTYGSVQDVFRPAMKYGMCEAIASLRKALKDVTEFELTDNFITGFAIAYENGPKEEARHAANRLISRLSCYQPNDEYGWYTSSSSAARYIRLLRYYKTCGRVARKLAREVILSSVAPDPRWTWNSCTVCKSTWWIVFISKTATALQRQPSGTTVSISDQLFRDTEKNASACGRCGQYGPHHVRSFVREFPGYLDDELLKVRRQFEVISPMVD